VGCTVL